MPLIETWQCPGCGCRYPMTSTHEPRSTDCDEVADERDRSRRY